MYFGSPKRQYNVPDRRHTWTAGLLGGAIGLLVMGAFWYRQTKVGSRPHEPRPLGIGHQGQAPARSHIQLLAHPARHM
jgi:hypothetical protein